jgi:primosomal replication protein N
MMRTGLDMQTIASDKCELDFSGTKYQCRLNSISSSGARVNCLGFLQETRRGDKAVLHLHAETNEIACRVTHITAAEIELRFGD